MNAVTKIEQNSLPGIPAEQPSMMELVLRAARDPDVDVSKMERLMQMAREMRQEEAKAAYIKALVKMKPKLPVIDRKGRIEVRAKGASGQRDGELTQNTPYALWEDIDEAITPILEEYGFVLTHRCGTAADGKILITGVLSHEAGHSEETTMALPHDSSGSKNAVQAVGSSTQYGKRYTAGLLLNIRTRGLDDDGKKGGDPGTISDEQAERLLEMLTRDKADVVLFCKHMKIASLIELPASRYEEAIIAINTRAAKVKQKEAAPMNIATPPESTQLVTIPQETALSVFTVDKAMDPFLQRIKAEVDAFVPDITTATGRKAVASMAYKVAQTKTYLESVGKALADEQKEIPKKIDACRKKVRDTLDKWRDEVRAPLTEWEAAEEARAQKHTDAITVLNELCRTAHGLGSAVLREGLAVVDSVTIGPSCEEFEADYARAKDAARASLMEELPKAEKRESDAAELLVLREEAAKRAEEDRVAAIQREAAEKATKAAEEDAQRKLDAEKEASEKAKRDADAKVAKAKADVEAADKRAAETEARLKKDAEDQANKIAAETARREADKEHRATINRAALVAFVAGGMTEETAKQALILIASRQIPAIQIFY